MRTKKRAIAALLATVTGFAATAPLACKNEGQTSASGGGGAGGAVLEPTLPYREGTAYTLPSGVTQLGAIAVDPASAKLYAASGSMLLRADAGKSGALASWKDLAAEGVTQIASLRVLAGGDLAVASSSDVVRLAPSGQVVSHARFAVAFGGGLGGPAVAVAPDGAQAYVVEGGPGSAGNGGAAVVHVARIDLAAAVAASPLPVSPAEVWELTEPFHVVPPEVGFINASAPVVSLDGQTLYLTHVVLRTVYAVGVGAPHSVTAVDTDSLQRSATVQSLDDGVLTQVATFDQTVPVFTMKDGLSAKLIAEIPVGQTPQGVASLGGRIFVSRSAGFGGFPIPGDGGVPGPGDGGFPGTSGGGDALPPALLVFELKKGGQ